MAIHQRKTPKMTRRSAMSSLASSAFICGSPGLLGAQTGGGMHHRVAAQVRSLVGTDAMVLRLLLPQGSQSNVGPVVAAFTEMTGVRIDITEVLVDEVNTELTLDALSNSQNYDVALPATFGLPDLVTAGAILPLTDFAAQYEEDGFRDGVLFDIGDSFDGDLYGFQADGDAYMMFYNKAMLENPTEQSKFEDAYGQSLSIPKTWQDLDRQMAFFNRPDDGQWGGLLFRTPEYLAWEWWIRFHAKGIWPFSADMEPQVASDQGVQALEEMIRATEHLQPQTQNLGLFENWERFSRGDVYCNIGWGGTQKYLMGPDSPMRGNMIYGQTPGGIVDGSLLETPYFNWGWNYVVSRNSRHPEVSYLFALFASTPEMSTRAIRETDGFFDPYRPEHYEDLKIQAAYSPEFLEVQRTSLIGAIPDLYIQNQGEYFRVLTQWLGSALSGEVSAKAALERVSRQWWLISSSSDLVQQGARWDRLKGKYPLDLQQRLRDV